MQHNETKQDIVANNDDTLVEHQEDTTKKTSDSVGAGVQKEASGVLDRSTLTFQTGGDLFYLSRF